MYCVRCGPPIPLDESGSPVGVVRAQCLCCLPLDKSLNLFKLSQITQQNTPHNTQHTQTHTHTHTTHTHNTHNYQEHSQTVHSASVLSYSQFPGTDVLGLIL